MNMLRRLNDYCLSGAGAAILLMTLLGGVDVLTTALFRQPIPGVYESTETLMVLVIFLALGYLQISNGNIAVDILTERLSPPMRLLQKVAAEALALAFFAVLAWQGWLLAVESWAIDEYSAGLVRFPLYPAKFAMAIGAGLTAVCCAARLINARALADEQPAIDPHAD